MAYVKIDYFCESLLRIVPIEVLIPNDVQEKEKEGNPNYQREMKTLYLLHGVTGNCTDWVTGTNIYELSKKYNLAVVCPSGDNSFYVDHNMAFSKYGTYVGEELVRYTRKMFAFSDKREDTFIGGFSMGGFGAIRNGLKYSETFGKLFAFSSALTIELKIQQRDKFDDGLTDMAYWQVAFGDIDKVAETDKYPKYIVKDILANNRPMPAMYLTCGTEDTLIELNRDFKDFLVANHVPVTYLESKGDHTWSYWGSVLEPAIKWLVTE